MTKKTYRITATLSEKHYDYLEQESEHTAMTKSSLIQLAVDTWIKQRESLDTLQKLTNELEMLKQFESAQKEDAIQ